MKPPEDAIRHLVRDWMDKAEQDYGLAQQLLSQSSRYLFAIGFHAQQAAEKYLKAYLVAHQIEFGKTHNLDKLLDLTASVERDLAESLREVAALTPYAAHVRYPSPYPNMTAEKAQEALRLATRVRDQILVALRGFLSEGADGK